MLLLDTAHRVILETLRDRFLSETPVRLDSRVSDLDNVAYHISTPESKSIIVLSMHCPCFDELKKHGAESVLKREYGPYLLSVPEAGYQISLQYDLANLPVDPAMREQLAMNAALLKRNVMAAPFEVAFDAQKAGKETSLMAIHYREEEAIYVKAMTDRVTVMFSTTFKDDMDKVFGKVFLQEFVDARRQPAIQNAPQVLYNPKEPPLELRHLPEFKNSENIGYVTFVLFPRHFSTPQAKEDCISRIQQFRDYLHYHIKCSKAYMHSRMRARVDSFLKVLNRAKPEREEKDRKTISGKTFKQK